MYIKRITLKNIRGFDELDFDLTRGDGGYAGWTVFTGDNGSGKSALLKAIVVGLLGKEIARALQPSFQGWIRDGENEASIKVETIERFEDDAASPLYGSTELGKLELKFENIGRETKLYDQHESDTFSWSHKGFFYHSFFICSYGPFRRMSGPSADAIRGMVAPDTESLVTLFQESATLAEVDQWLIKLHHKSLEKKYPETHLLGLVPKILSDDLLHNQITVDRVDSDGLWLKDRNGVELAWSDMSDGYRSALALLSDILRHLMNDEDLGRYSIVENSDGKLVVNRHGVVLIDEIDAHLHPEWQQKIGFWLKRHFPNIQFLVTTHSPIICQAADDNGLFVLPGSQDKPKALSKEEYNKVIASRPDTILLTSAFGLQNTRSPRAVEGRAEYAKLKSKRRAGAQLTQDEEDRMGELEVFGKNEEEL